MSTRLFIAFILFAVPARASLESAVATALDRSPEISAAQARVRQAEADVRAARRYENPEVEGEVARADPENPREKAATEWSVGGKWPVDIGGQVRYRTAAARAALFAARKELTNAKREVAAKAAETYLEAGFARERLRLAEEVRDVRERLLVIASERLRVEDIPRLDYDLAFAEREAAVAAIERKKADVQEADARLAAALFLPSGETFPVDRDLWVSVPPGGISQLFDSAILRRGDLEALSLRAASETQAARALYASRWNGASVNGRFEVEGPENDRERTIGVGVTIPLPILNNRSGERDAAYARADELLHDARALRRDIFADIEASSRRLERSEQALRHYRTRVVPLAEKNALLMEEAYVAGRVKALDVIQAEERYLSSLGDYLDVLEERSNAAQRLVAAVADTWTSSSENLPEYRHIDAPVPRSGLETAEVRPAAEADRTAPTSHRYTIQPGDNLFSIARSQLGEEARWKEIADLNRIGPPYSLRAGQELILPEKTENPG